MIIMALFGRTLYCLIQLEDLANDKINPYDMAKAVNGTVMLEYAATVLLTAVLLVNGFWLTAVLQLVASVILTQQYMKGELVISPTDAFKRLSEVRWRKGVVFAVHAICFMVAIYRLIEGFIDFHTAKNKHKLSAVNAYREHINKHFGGLGI